MTALSARVLTKPHCRVNFDLLPCLCINPPCKILATVHLCLSFIFRVTPCRGEMMLRGKSSNINAHRGKKKKVEMCCKYKMYHWLRGIFFKHHFFHFGQLSTIRIFGTSIDMNLSTFILKGLHGYLQNKN